MWDPRKAVAYLSFRGYRCTHPPPASIRQGERDEGKPRVRDAFWVKAFSVRVWSRLKVVSILPYRVRCFFFLSFLTKRGVITHAEAMDVIKVTKHERLRVIL